MKPNNSKHTFSAQNTKNTSKYYHRDKKQFNYFKLKNRFIQPQNTLPVCRTVTFEDKYLNMMMNHKNINDLENNIEYIKKLKEIIEEEGGILEVTSNGNWGKITQRINSSNFKFNGQNLLSQERIFEYSQQYLFPYFFAKDHRKKQEQLYYIPLCKSKFVEKQIFRECFQDLSKGLEYYNQPIVVFRDCQKQTKLNLEIINLQYVGQIYGDNIIDIRVQKPCQYGYKGEKLCNSQYQMKIKEYRQYQQNYDKPEFLEKFVHSNQIKDGKLFFGVNFDAEKRGDDVINHQLISKLSGTFLSNKQHFDLLSYMDEDIPGCSLPQIYFKVKGCWTGGHQQNCNMSSININHGPDASEWYAVDFEHCQQLREAILAEYKVDIFLNEGLWFPKWQWLIQKGVPVRKIEQKKGDIIVLGFGTLHWVRSLGVSMHSSWNSMIKNQSQVKRSLQRHTQNKRINFPRKDIIPLKSIMLRYLNHQYSTMTKEMKLIVSDRIKHWLQQQKENFQKIPIKRQLSISQKYIEDLESYCNNCKDQVLLYYSNYPQIQGIICLFCYIKLNYPQRNIYIKFAINSIEQLLRLSLQPFETKQIDNLCKGRYIGNVSCKKHQQQLRMQMEANHLVKLNQITILKKQQQSLTITSIFINQKPNTIPKNPISPIEQRNIPKNQIKPIEQRNIPKSPISPIEQEKQPSQKTCKRQIEDCYVKASQSPNNQERFRTRNKEEHNKFNDNQSWEKNKNNNKFHKFNSTKEKYNDYSNQILSKYKYTKIKVYSYKSQFAIQGGIDQIDNNYRENYQNMSPKKNYQKNEKNRN